MSRGFPSRRTVLKSGAAVLATAGCASTRTAPAAKATARLEKRSLTVGAIQSVTACGLYIAAQRGYFGAEGLRVTIAPTTGSGPVMTDLLNGRLDINFGNYVSFLAAQAAGVADLHLLAAGDNVAAHELEILVAPGSPVTSVPMLRGKTIGVNALQNVATLFVSSVLAGHGVPTSAYRFTAIPFPEMGAAVAAHRVDAGLLVEPFLTEAKAKDKLRSVADVDQGATAGFPISGYAVTAAWMKKYPNTAAAFVRALVRGQRLAATSRAAIEQALPHYITISQQVAAVVVTGEFPDSVNVAQIQHVADVMRQFGMLRRPLNVATMIG
jgi:NitT/TauT family transport system substrate-binding protein